MKSLKDTLNEADNSITYTAYTTKRNRNSIFSFIDFDQYELQNTREKAIEHTSDNIAQYQRNYDKCIEQSKIDPKSAIATKNKQEAKIYKRLLIASQKELKRIEKL